MSFICNLCPRMCGVDRQLYKGFCGAGDSVRVARAALYFMEEPCISGKNGSGTVFFSGCNLKCCFCQNYQLSHENYGKDISVKRLSDIFLELQDKGAHNINLVTAAMYVPWVIKALDLVKHRLSIPIVYNSGGYENVSTIEQLKGYVDIYLDDIKYYNDDMAVKYSRAERYFENASNALQQMIKQVGKPKFKDEKVVDDDDALMTKGVIIRHLILPGGRKDSINIIKWLNDNLSPEDYLISLMSQYTPVYKSTEYKEINRRVMSFEYDSVVEEARKMGIINGYIQDRSSAKSEYTPPFNLEGI